MEWILLSVFAGLCNGAFALPMKFTTKWKWENIWGLFSLWGFVIFPILLAVITVPELVDLFRQVGIADLTTVFLFGFLWGIGSICFGLGIRYLGIGLAFSLNIGITIAIGSLIPLFQGSTLADTESKNVNAVVMGVMIIIIGVIINGYAAFLREKDQVKNEKNNLTVRPLGRAFLIGILVCVMAGIMSPMLQFAFIRGESIIQVANDMGIGATRASNTIWMIALFGGFVVNALYSSWLLVKNKSWRLYKIKEAKRYHVLAITMGLLWVVTISCYGMAVSNMGNLGLSVGWAIFNSVGIIAANLLGFITNEWRKVRRNTLVMVSLGLVVLVLGTCVVGLAQFLKP